VSGATTAEIVERGDLDELIRQVDRLTEASDWNGLVDLRDRSRRALERGRQLWPAASLAEYRLALRAPGDLAAAVVTDRAAAFTLGPLTEVAASTHAWSELAPSLSAGAPATVVAYERVIRGEDLDDEARVDRRLFEIPFALQPWEPAYSLAVYRDDSADFPTPAAPRFAPQPLPRRDGDVARSGPECEALVELVKPWTTQSNGTAAAAAVDGDLFDAVATVADTPVGLAEVTPEQGLAWMAWAGASGGAHGRRRGMATGRFNAWWAAAAVCGFGAEWPIDPDELGEAVGELRWALWRPEAAAVGWQLHLAVEDPTEGLAWALSATDQM
jgi:resuscitation-promoting factor RpfA